MLCGGKHRETFNLESDPFSTLASNLEILRRGRVCKFVSFGGREGLWGQGLYLADSPAYPQALSSSGWFIKVPNKYK